MKSQKTEIFQVGKRHITNQKMIDNWGNAKITLSQHFLGVQVFNPSHLFHAGHHAVSRPVRLLETINFVYDHSFIQNLNGHDRPGNNAENIKESSCPTI
jgi:hypothetical protein